MALAAISKASKGLLDKGKGIVGFQDRSDFSFKFGQSGLLSQAFAVLDDHRFLPEILDEAGDIRLLEMGFRYVLNSLRRGYHPKVRDVPGHAMDETLGVGLHPKVDLEPFEMRGPLAFPAGLARYAQNGETIERCRPNVALTLDQKNPASLPDGIQMLQTVKVNLVLGPP